MKKTSRTTRTRVKSKDTEKFLADVPPEFVFWLRDGRALKNMKELGEALQTMSDEIYSSHADSGKNDFSKWVNDIITDTKLSIDLAGATSRDSAAMIVTERVKQINAKPL